MSSSLPALADHFLVTVQVSLHASIIIAALLILRPILKRFLPAQWVYLLWFLVVIRLLLVEVPSVNAVSSPPLQQALAVAQDFNPADTVLAPTQLKPVATVASTATSWPHLLAVVWIVGVAALLLRFAVTNFRWLRRLADAPEIQEPEVVRLLEKCRREMGVRHVRLLQVGGFASPCITGLFRPAIVLPEDFIERFTSEELRWIFLHELAHLKRWDLAVQFLCQILQALHWFNPLVWFAFACFRCDRELACDAAVLDRQTSPVSRDYGHALIKVAEIYPRSLLSPGFLGISEEKTDLQERVEKISRHRRPKIIWAVAGLVLGAVLALVFLTRMAPPPHAATVKLQVYKDGAYVPAEVEVIQSENVVVPAIVGLGLDKTWAARLGTGESALTPAEIMDRVSRMLTVKMRPDTTDVVYVTVQGGPPQEAADMANAIAGQYVSERHAATVKDVSDQVHHNHDAQIANFEAQLAEDTAALDKLENEQKTSTPNAFPAGGWEFAITQAKNQVARTQKNLDQAKADLAYELKNQIETTSDVRILAPAY